MSLGSHRPQVPNAVSMKQAQKMGQAYRREFRAVLHKYEVELRDRLMVFNRALKPRPRWFPKPIWKFMGNWFIDIEQMNTLINPMPAPPDFDVHTLQNDESLTPLT